MNNLTTKELKIFNNLSRVQSPSVSLGDKIQEIIGAIHGTSGSPVNAVAAQATLNVGGVVTHGETLGINNPLKAGEDRYVFMADEAQEPVVSTDIPVDVSAYTTASTINLTVDIQPIAGDKMIIGTKEYTFTAIGANDADGKISVEVDLDGAQAAIVAAINGTDGVNTPNPVAKASAFDAGTDICAITALVGGIAGNAIATTETFTAGTNVFAADKLAGGVDCLAANAITALVSAITASDTQGVGAIDGNGNTVVLTADVAGVDGNDIVVGAVMANGTFANAATELAGGINGTVGTAGEIHMDSSYVYIAIDDNAITDANWRRIEVGSVY